MPKKPAETGTISTFLSDKNRHSLCWRHGDAHSFKAPFKVRVPSPSFPTLLASRQCRRRRVARSFLCSNNAYSMMSEAPRSFRPL